MSDEEVYEDDLEVIEPTPVGGRKNNAEETSFLGQSCTERPLSSIDSTKISDNDDTVEILFPNFFSSRTAPEHHQVSCHHGLG